MYQFENFGVFIFKSSNSQIFKLLMRGVIPRKFKINKK